MTIYNVRTITLPEEFVIIEVSYKQFREFHKGEWTQSIIFRTKKGYLYSFTKDRSVMICKDEDSKT